jgi:hypothetical protein
MTGARYDRFRTWLRMLCTYVRDSGFETYWKYVCDGYEAGLNRPLNGGGGPDKSCFLYPKHHPDYRIRLPRLTP